MVQGGPYVEDGEGRRRSRYAVVTALLNSGWRPSDEDKLGYVWTFESCILKPWERRAPELLPYEWFIRADQPQGPPRALLVLWVDEDALAAGRWQGLKGSSNASPQRTVYVCLLTSGTMKSYERS